MRAYFSATLNVDPLAFTLMSSYCSSNIDSISGENKRGDILKFEKNGTAKRERNNIIYYCCQSFARERDLENRLVSFHGRFYHKTTNIEPPSLEKLTAMKLMRTERLHTVTALVTHAGQGACTRLETRFRNYYRVHYMYTILHVYSSSMYFDNY